MTSADQLKRLFALVPYLRAHPDALVKDTALVFGVSPETLLADLNVLWFCGLPGGLPDDLIEIDMDAARTEGTIRLTNADFLARPMRFTLPEAFSLVVALRGIRELATGATVQAVDSVLAKLTLLVGSEATAVGVRVSTGEGAVRDALAQAIEARRRVILTYHAPTRSEPSEPLVEPALLVMRDGIAYLQAWAVDREGWRTYRLDRIVEVVPTEAAADDHGTPPPFDPGWINTRPDAVPVRLDVSGAGAWIAEYYPTRSVTRIGDLIQVELLVADPAWLRALLLRLGPAVRAVDPPEVAWPAREAAAAALALYDASEPR